MFSDNYVLFVFQWRPWETHSVCYEGNASYNVWR